MWYDPGRQSSERLRNDKEVVMPKAYSMDLRERVIAACDAGDGTKTVAERFEVSPAWVRRLKQHRRERGDIQPRRGGHAPRKVDREQLAAWVAERPDATLAELRDALGVDVSLSTIWVALRQLGLSYKKSRFTPPSRIVPTWPSVAPPGGWGSWG